MSIFEMDRSGIEDSITPWDEHEWVQVGGFRLAAPMPTVDTDGSGRFDSALLMLELEPGTVEPPHWHPGGHITVVTEGWVMFNDKRANAGDVRIIPPGMEYGTVAGPEGAKLIEFWPDREGFVGRLVNPDDIDKIAAEELAAQLDKLPPEIAKFSRGVLGLE
jgi:quercetin dioxygenase-like cupin family protein